MRVNIGGGQEKLLLSIKQLRWLENRHKANTTVAASAGWVSRKQFAKYRPE